MPKLAPKQELFCKEYLVDLNATQAAIRAGYSKKTAKSQGQRLLTHVDIGPRLQELMDKRSEKVEITADWVLKGVKELTDKLVQGEDPSKAYKGYELAGRHLKMFTDKIEQDMTVTVTEIHRKII